MKNSIKTLEERIETLMKEWIVVSINYTDEDNIRITKRDNFQKMGMCDCYNNYGQQSDCCTAGCYSFDNSSSTFLSDCIDAIEAKFKLGFCIDIEECAGKQTVISLDDDKELNEDQVSEIDKFIVEWAKENETHTEVTGWTYHDSHNFRTVVLATDFGESDCEEFDEEETRAILTELPGFPHIERIGESVETENYRFSFDLWATNPWYCSVEKL